MDLPYQSRTFPDLYTSLIATTLVRVPVVRYKIKTYIAKKMPRFCNNFCYLGHEKIMITLHYIQYNDSVCVYVCLSGTGLFIAPQFSR